jgi:hypothetical protein
MAIESEEEDYFHLNASPTATDQMMFDVIQSTTTNC